MLMMVGNDQKKTKSRTKESKTGGNMKKSSSRSGRTSPGLNVKRFTIPKKQKELLNEVELDSSEYLREVLPIIQQGYRESSSKNKFNYEKVQLIHNPVLKKEFIEKKREMKDAGRNEKELIESYAFLYVKTEEKAKQLCQESLDTGTKEKRKHCLGSPSMGVHVCRYSDVLHRNTVPKEGIILLVKVLKGKVKAVPLVYGAAEILEPTPNYDCHVAKNSGEEIPSSASHRLFDSSELFIYDFDEDEVEFRKRPRNICPYAVVHFTYSDTGVPSALPSSSNFNRTPVASSNETTPSRNISVPDTVGIAVVAPCFPRDDIVTQLPMSDADRPFIEKYKEYSERSYRVWSGQLLNKNGNSCRVSLLSFGLSFLPCKMPEALQACKAVRMKELRLPTKVFTGTVPVLSRVKEAQANGKYYWYAELHSLSLDDKVYSRFLNYLSEKELVLKKELGDKVLLYILPTGKTTQNLGLTASSHPKILHCLVESYVPMVSHLTDITVKQPRHQVKPNLESAPIHDIDKDHLKRLRFQSSLAKLFYEQNRELKDNGVPGDLEEIPLPRQSSVEQSSVEPDEPVVETVIEMSPASPDEQVDENLNSYIPRSQHLEHQQSNQRTAAYSKPEASPVDEQHSADIHDWNNYPNDWRSEHPSSTQPWDHSQPPPNHQKEHNRNRVETKESRDPRVNIHKQLQPGGEPSNHHVSQQSPSSHPPSSNPGEHHRLGHQQYEQQSGRTESQSGHQSYERQSSKEWGPPKGSSPRGRGSQSRSHQDTHPHHQKHPPKPPDNQQYKRQASSEWTNQQPSAKHKPNQDKRPLEASQGDLPPQIKEVASKVHKMLTSGLDLGLRGAAGDANVQTVQEETDDEKIARMRATLQALVEERERLAKSNSDKDSADPPTSVPSPKGNEVLSTPPTNMDTTSEPKHPSQDSPKESTVVEKPNTTIVVVEKPKENAHSKGNGIEADVKMEERVDVYKEEAMDIVDSDEGEEEKEIVQERDIVKRKLEESEEPAKKKMRVDDVPTAEAEREKGDVTKDSPVVPKTVVQKNVAVYGVKTVSNPISRTDSTEQQPKGTTDQKPISAKGPVDPKQTEPMTKTQKDQTKIQTLEMKPKSDVVEKNRVSQTLEKKPKSDVGEKNRVSKKSENADKPSKVPEEITSASQMREYLERRHSSDKKGSKEHISSASEMKMFLENPDKVSTKPRRIKSASEMRQFLNQPFTRDKSSKTPGSEGHKGRPTAAAPDITPQYPELEGKSRDDLLKNHDGELPSNHLQNFLSTHHQITWSLSQGVRVTVNREMAGAKIGPPPPGALRKGMDEEEDDCTSSITAVCHGSYRSMNGTQPDTSTKEGLADQIRQVIHHSQPVKKVEARKVKEIQKGGKRRRKSSTGLSTESQDQGRGESPANIPDGKKRDNSKSTSKKQPRIIKLTAKENHLSKVKTLSHAVGSKETSLQVPMKHIKLKIKKIKKSCTPISSSGEAAEKEIKTTQARHAIDSTRGRSQKKNNHKDNAMTQTGKPSGSYVSGKKLPKTKLDHQSSADKIIDRAQAAVDVTEAVRDMVTCLSTDDIRQLIGVFDDLFSSRPDINQSQPVPSDNKDVPDAMQLSTVDPQSCGDPGQSGLQREDQGGGDKEKMVLISPKKSVSKTSSDRKDHLADQGNPSQNKEKAKCQVDDVEQLEEDHPLEQKMEAGRIVADTKQLGEDHPLKQGIPVLHKVDAQHLVGDVKPFEMPTLTLEIDEKEKPAGETEPTEDEDTLPYPLELVDDGASRVEEVTTGCTNDKGDEACIHLYDSDRWSELDEDIQADASKEHTPQKSTKQSRKVQPLDVAATSLEKTKQLVKDHAGDTALSLVSDTAQSVPSNKVSAAKNPQRADMLSILIRECENKTPIKKVTDKEHREPEGSKKVSIFERLSAVQPKTRNVVKDEKESADDHGISLESGDKVERNDSPQPTSSLPALPEVAQSVLSISADKGTVKDEKTTRFTVFDRLNTKQPGQEPQKKRVSVFDRLYVPKTVKPEPTLTEPSKLERVSAFDRLSTRKVTKTSTQEKEKQKEDTSSKVIKEKTMVKPVLSSKVKKVDSGKATAGVASTVGTVKPMKARGVVQKDMLKDVLKSKKRELPKEDVPANKKYKLAIKDQGDKKEKYINQQKENVTSKKEDKLVSKDSVRRAEMYNDLPRETVASSNRNKHTTKSHGKREEKVIDLQRKRDTSSKKPLPDQARRDKNYVDKRSDKRYVSRTHEERKDREHKRHSSRGRDSDHSSVSTKEDSDTIRKNILKKANDLASDFSKYVVSGRYLELEGKSPSLLNDPDPVVTLSNNITDGAGLEKCSNMAKEKTAVDGYPRKVQSKCVSKTTNVAIQNNEEIQPFSFQESYLVLDQTQRDINYSQVNEQQIHTISVIGGSTANSMRPFHEMSVDNDAITNGLPDDLPLDRIAIMGNREGDGSSSEKIQIQILGEPYNSVSPEPSTILSPETKRAFEQALKGSIGSPTKQDYRPESPTNSIISLSNGHQDQVLTKNDVPPPTSSHEESTSTFTQITYERDESCQDHEDSRKVKTSLKAPSSRQVYCGNRFHPYDKRLKTFQGHCHNLREPETAELIANFCKEEYRLRKLRAAARVSALSKQEEFFDQARLSPSRFGSLNDMSHDEGVIQRSEEVEMTHSREGAGDAVAGQREDKLQILDKQIKDLTASGSGIQDFFILDANVYPIKNGDDSALSGVPPKTRARRGRGRPQARRHGPPHGPPHPYQIRTHYQGHPSTSRDYSQDRWNGPSDRSWNGPSQRSMNQWDRSPRHSPQRNFHYRKGN